MKMPLEPAESLIFDDRARKQAFKLLFFTPKELKHRFHERNFATEAISIATCYKKRIAFVSITSKTGRK
jgi:hypothetical protein